MAGGGLGGGLGGGRGDDGSGRLVYGPGDPTLPGGGGQGVLGGDPDAPDIPLSEEERHLRGARELVGYEVVGTDAGADGRIGPVTDLLIHRDDPAVSWLVVDAGGWLAQREVVLDPKWARDISWAQRRVNVALARERVAQAPALESLDGVDHAYGTALAAFYRFVS